MAWVTIYHAAKKLSEHPDPSGYEPPVTSEEFESPVLGKVGAMITASLIVVAFIVLAGALLLGAAGISLNIITQAAPTPAPPVLGDQLVFPDGWTPVACADDRLTQGHCSWICQSAVRSDEFRECIPARKPQDVFGVAP